MRAKVSSVTFNGVLQLPTLRNMEIIEWAAPLMTPMHCATKVFVCYAFSKMLFGSGTTMKVLVGSLPRLHMYNVL